LLGKIMDKLAETSFRFGPFELQPSERRLLRAGTPVSLTPKTLDLLVLLVVNHDRLLTKNEIQDQLWPDVNVGESNLTATMSMLRRVLESTDDIRYIENVPKQGYRFCADVTEGPLTKKTAESATSRSGVALWLAGGTLVLLTIGMLWFWLGHPSPWRKYFNEAIQYERSGDDFLALKALDRAIAANPKFAEAYLKGAFISYQVDEDDRSTEYLKHAIELADHQNEDFRLKSNGLQELLVDNSEGAITQFRLASDNYPDDTDAHFALADLALDLGREAETEEALKRCFAVDKNNPFCHYVAMFLDLQRNRFNAVLERFNDLKKAGLGYPYWEAPVGLAYLGNDDVPAALAHFKKLQDASLRFHGRIHSQAANDLTAEAEVYRGRIDDAERQLMEGYDSSTSPTEKADYQVGLAQQSAILGKIAKARSALERALAEPMSPEIRSKAAVIFAMTGDRSAASTALSVGGPHPLAQREVDGLLALSEGRTDLAIKELKSSYEEYGDVEIAYWLGGALMSAGKCNEAAQYYGKIIDSKGRVLAEEPVMYWILAHYQQAICYQKMGLDRQALQRYEQFLSNWKEADPDLAQVKDARRQVDVLSRS
jgi:DNA-binding winged helix-turn-helix (wHTH) protein/tetratricopeptide (TPR) repeat protein